MPQLLVFVRPAAPVHGEPGHAGGEEVGGPLCVLGGLTRGRSRRFLPVLGGSHGRICGQRASRCEEVHNGDAGKRRSFTDRRRGHCVAAELLSAGGAEPPVSGTEPSAGGTAGTILCRLPPSQSQLKKKQQKKRKSARELQHVYETERRVQRLQGFTRKQNSFYSK